VSTESRRVLLALVLAVVLGALVSASGSAPLLRGADALAPIGALWVNAIRMTVVPLVVSLIVTGVASAAELRTIGRLGGRSVLTFVLLLAGTAAVIVPLAPLVFALLPSGGARPPLPAGAMEAASDVAAGGRQTLGTWLTSLIPPNPVAAAASGAMLPLILFTLLFALAVTRTSPAARAAVVGFFGAVGEAMLVLVRWIIAAAPVGVFALVLPLAARLGTSMVGAIGFYVVAYSVACVVVILLLYPVVAMAGRVPMRRFARAALPAQLIALSSSSSLATLPALVESAEDGLGLSTQVTGFVLPLAVSTFKIAGPVSWTIGALFVGAFYGVPLHARELATIAFAAVFLGFGVPGVPRGAFIMLAPLFTAIGLPVEGLGILIAVDALPDTFATALNVTGDLAATALVARGQGRGAGSAGALDWTDLPQPMPELHPVQRVE
jgi:proton glutamate symport protein